MKKLRLVTIIFALILAGGLLLLPSVRFPLIGWLKGESFYDGLPTSYWVHDVQTSELLITPDGMVSLKRPSSWRDWLSRYVPLYREPRTFATALEHNAGDNLHSAVAVLSEMLGYSDQDVRMFATMKLYLLFWGRGHLQLHNITWPEGWSDQQFQEALAPAYAPLLQVLNDPSEITRNHAAAVLWIINPDRAKGDGVRLPTNDAAFEEASPPP